MKSPRSWFGRQLAVLAATFLASALTALPIQAETATYTYDALGRLTKVEKSDGSGTIYALDAAGNRTQVLEATMPSAPQSITVPSSSTGSYTISWTAPVSGTVIVYELYESTSANFASQTLVHNASATSKPFSGKGNGTYYYRVRACAVSCGDYTSGGNPVIVRVPPGTPESISVPSTNTTGNYSISWTPPTTGTVTAYELYEATASNFSGQVLIYNGTNDVFPVSGRGNGTYYYRVRACNGTSCSGYRPGTNSIVVTLPPSTPESITVPTSSNTGNYTVHWDPAEIGNVTAYQLYEATNSSFTGATRLYNSTGTTFPVTGRTDGTYYYRVRACNGNACSGYRAGTNPIVVTRPPSTPPSITVPTSSNTGSYTVFWTRSRDRQRNRISAIRSDQRIVLRRNENLQQHRDHLPRLGSD